MPEVCAGVCALVRWPAGVDEEPLGCVAAAGFVLDLILSDRN